MRLLAYLGRRIGEWPILLVATASQDELPEAPALNRWLGRRDQRGEKYPHLLRPHLGGPLRRGTRFKGTDTVLNDAPAGMPRSTTTRYDLSAETVRSAGDTLLTGGRTTRAPGPTGRLVRARLRRHPGNHPPGHVCPAGVRRRHEDGLRRQRDNNCRASGTPIAVNP